MLGLIFICLTAKPISIRRLSMLFTVALISGRAALALLHVENAPSAGVAVALALTICAWAAPLIRFVLQTLCSGIPSWHVFDSVSNAVKCTYGFVLAMLALVPFQEMLAPTHAVTLSTLLRTIITALTTGILVSTVSGAQRKRKGGPLSLAAHAQLRGIR